MCMPPAPPAPTPSIEGAAYIKAFNEAAYFSSSAVVALITFITFSFLGGTLQASSVFYVLSLIQASDDSKPPSPCVSHHLVLLFTSITFSLFGGTLQASSVSHAFSLIQMNDEVP